MRKVIPLIIILAGAFAAGATHRVNGTVIEADTGDPLPEVNVRVKHSKIGTVTDINGEYQLDVPSGKSTLIFEFIGMETAEVKVQGRAVIDVEMEPDMMELEEVVVSGMAVQRKRMFGSSALRAQNSFSGDAYMMAAPADPGIVHNTEGYSAIHEIGFKRPQQEALSTFSIDVDAASYSNVRRFVNYGQLPPKDAVRIEELVNYFNYDYAQPQDEHPFAINSDIAKAPWNEDHLLVQIGLQGKEIPTDDLPPSNLVFLLDVSGSMSDPNKLPLLKSSFRLLVQEMRPKDRVAIVVYAGAAGLVLPSTPGTEKGKILEALNQLSAGGSTAGGAGIQLAYQTARDHFIDGGNNRVILATDGDFNVGASSNAEMERLIEKKRDEGVFLTVLGFGMGNYKDDKMEILADKGNGNYAYIDNIREARKVLINEFGGTLFTIAKDVKIQVEFNPTKVQGYRLIGYENRRLEAEDFNDDKKDAGELGSGHTVTALYEIIPVGVDSDFLKDVDSLKYQTTTVASGGASDEWLTVKFRYKDPNGTKSKLLSRTLTGPPNMQLTENMAWSTAVAGFGMLLRDSEYKGDLTYSDILSQARKAIGADEFGYRREFLDMVRTAKDMSPQVSANR